MSTITIPKKEYEELKRHASAYLKIVEETFKAKKDTPREDEEITEESVLRMAKEARQLYRAGKLPLFKDLIKKEYPQLAKKYSLK